MGLEQPADVRVPQARDHPAQARAVAGVGAVRVALFVGERVVLAVVGDPVDHRALQRHRAEDRERVAQPRARLEGAMGQQAVKADRDAERGQQVHDGEDRQVARPEEVVPQHHRCADHAEEGDHDGGDVDVALQTGHLSSGIPRAVCYRVPDVSGPPQAGGRAPLVRAPRDRAPGQPAARTASPRAEAP